MLRCYREQKHKQKKCHKNKKISVRRILFLFSSSTANFVRIKGSQRQIKHNITFLWHGILMENGTDHSDQFLQPKKDKNSSFLFELSNESWNFENLRWNSDGFQGRRNLTEFHYEIVDNKCQNHSITCSSVSCFRTNFSESGIRSKWKSQTFLCQMKILTLDL